MSYPKLNSMKTKKQKQKVSIEPRVCFIATLTGKAAQRILNKQAEFYKRGVKVSKCDVVQSILSGKIK